MQTCLPEPSAWTILLPESRPPQSITTESSIVKTTDAGHGFLQVMPGPASVRIMSLDQLVKGSPAAPDVIAPPSEPLHFPASSDVSDSETPTRSPSFLPRDPASATADPLSILPSSPSQIYLNLLILEASLRAQYLSLRARRRQNTFFVLLLVIWITYFAYALFLRPREDGRGVGGSVYWAVETCEKVALLGGVVTGILIWGTGQWERGMRWPRRWLAVTNRGLRGINAKIVVIKGPWWRELLSSLAFLFPFPALFFSANTIQHIEPHDHPSHHTSHHNHGHTREPSYIEEDLSPGGDHIKLLLLPKAFSPAFRDNWDQYRTSYWERENERRASLRRRLRERDRNRRKVERGWFWWLGIKSKRLNRPTGSSTYEKKPSGGRRPSSSSSARGTPMSEKRYLQHSSRPRQRRESDVSASGSNVAPSGRGATPTIASDNDDNVISTATSTRHRRPRSRRESTTSQGTPTPTPSKKKSSSLRPPSPSPT